MYLASEDPTELVPLKYSFCNSSIVEDMSSLKGLINFRVLNYRGDVVFRLFVGWQHPVLIAQSQNLKVRTPGYPTGVRLALTGAPGEVAVTWTSTSRSEKGACVKYEILDAEGRIIKTDVSNVSMVRSYQSSDLCGPPATAEGFRDPGFFYTAKVSGIRPDCIVMYRVGSDMAWSQQFRFRSTPASGSPVKIFAFGDLGEHPRDDSAQGQGQPWYSQDFAYGDPGVHNTTSAMYADHRTAPADLVLHNGICRMPWATAPCGRSFMTISKCSLLKSLGW
jgi:hypothetical protein